jgi:hypothetical protein
MLVSTDLTFLPWLWCLTYIIKSLTLCIHFWLVCTRTLVFRTSVCCDKFFQMVQTSFTLWPWPLCLTGKLKIFTLALSFECYVLGLWYCTWVFLKTRPWHGYINRIDLHHYIENLNFSHKSWIVCTKNFIWLFFVRRPFHGLWPLVVMLLL